MSSIPNNAMPHAGGNTASDQNNSQTRTRSEQAGSYRSPESYSRDWNSSRDRSQGGATFMERARENKTGIAVGVAVGAIAAAAIPFMLSGKKKSPQYDREIYVDNSETSRSGDAHLSAAATSTNMTSKRS